MDKNKIVGLAIAAILVILGAFGVVNSDAVKGEICGTPAAPAAVAK